MCYISLLRSGQDSLNLFSVLTHVHMPIICATKAALIRNNSPTLNLEGGTLPNACGWFRLRLSVRMSRAKS